MPFEEQREEVLFENKAEEQKEYQGSVENKVGPKRRKVSLFEFVKNSRPNLKYSNAVHIPIEELIRHKVLQGIEEEEDEAELTNVETDEFEGIVH